MAGRDAGLATHIVYGTLRYLPALRLALEPLLRGKTAPKAQALLLAGPSKNCIWKRQITPWSVSM
ncbi:hypothetical protein [Deinococcus radiophilus]|uniref:hypothetical protein n=1 Tax=Deinococcus radiophilus TaxID=32062 RepID=UPI003620FE54